MKKKEETPMQIKNLLEKAMPNRRFMTLLWHHHWRNHYSYDVIRVTRSSANLYLYYFIIKCNLFIKILQRGKNTKNMKFVQNYKFPKIFRCFQQNSHCRTSESCRTLKISQKMLNRYKLKVIKTQPTLVYTFWNFYAEEFKQFNPTTENKGKVEKNIVKLKILKSNDKINHCCKKTSQHVYFKSLNRNSKNIRILHWYTIICKIRLGEVCKRTLTNSI